MKMQLGGEFVQGIQASLSFGIGAIGIRGHGEERVDLSAGAQGTGIMDLPLIDELESIQRGIAGSVLVGNRVEHFLQSEKMAFSGDPQEQQTAPLTE